jgi:hypothetical protein
VRLNGTTTLGMIQVSTDNSSALGPESICVLYNLSAGDYVELMVRQGSAGALNVVASGNTSPEFWMHRIG